MTYDELDYDELDYATTEQSEYEEVLLATETTVAKAVYIGAGVWRVVVYTNFAKDRNGWKLDYKNTMTEPDTDEIVEAIKIALKRAGANQDISVTTE